MDANIDVDSEGDRSTDETTALRVHSPWSLATSPHASCTPRATSRRAHIVHTHVPLTCLSVCLLVCAMHDVVCDRFDHVALVQFVFDPLRRLNLGQSETTPSPSPSPSRDTNDGGVNKHHAWVLRV
jgi:hypothetical protein